jgi:uncharacterized protein YkwD
MRTPGLLVAAATGVVLTAGLVAATTAGAQTAPAAESTATEAWSADPWSGGDWTGDAWPWAEPPVEPSADVEPSAGAEPSATPRPTTEPDAKPAAPDAEAAEPDAEPAAAKPAAAKPAAKPAARPAAAPPVAADPADRPGDDAAMQQQALRFTNDARRRHGCPALTINARLVQAARRHAADMVSRGYFEHRSPSGDNAGDRVAATGYDWSAYGENIARGQDSAAEVVQDWMDSPSHRENILTCGFSEVGVGRAYDADHKAYWVQNFATPDND